MGRKTRARADGTTLYVYRVNRCDTRLFAQMADAVSNGLLAFRLLKIGGIIMFDDEADSVGVAKATAALESALGDGLQVLHRQVTDGMAYFESQVLPSSYSTISAILRLKYISWQSYMVESCLTSFTALSFRRFHFFSRFYMGISVPVIH